MKLWISQTQIYEVFDQMGLISPTSDFFVPNITQNTVEEPRTEYFEEGQAVHKQSGWKNDKLL